MKGIDGFQNEGYTIMTLMRMTFGEFDVSWVLMCNFYKDIFTLLIIVIVITITIRNGG